MFVSICEITSLHGLYGFGLMHKEKIKKEKTVFRFAFRQLIAVVIVIVRIVRPRLSVSLRFIEVIICILLEI